MTNKDVKKITTRENSAYEEIRHSVVSWRKKSSYKKKLKRLISKKARRILKRIENP